MSDNCKGCFYSKPIYLDGHEGEEWYQESLICRYDPPSSTSYSSTYEKINHLTYKKTGDMGTHHHQQTSWPQVGCDDWCGRWKKKEEE